MRIDLGTFSFNTLAPDANGTYWYITAWDGWDSTNVRQTTLAPTGQHYEVLAESLKGSRPISLSGIVKANSAVNYWAAWNALSDYLDNLLSNVDLKVYEEPTTRKVSVVRTGPARFRQIGVNAFEFEIALTAFNSAKSIVV